MIIPLLFAAFTGALAPSSVVAARPSSGVSAPAKATASQGASPRGSRKTNPFGNLFGAKPTQVLTACTASAMVVRSETDCRVRHDGAACGPDD
jgi:hypothetical protein